MLCLTIYKTAPIVVKGNFILELIDTNKARYTCTLKYRNQTYTLEAQENVDIEDNVTVQFNGFYKHGVNLGFTAPREVPIDRLRVYQAKGGTLERPSS